MDKNILVKKPLVTGIVLNIIMGIVSRKILLKTLVSSIMTFAVTQVAGTETDIKPALMALASGTLPVILVAILINIGVFFLMKKHISKKGLYFFITGLVYVVSLVVTFIIMDF